MPCQPKKLLVVMPTIPYPPRAHGLSIRYLPILERICAHHAVDLVMIVDGMGDGVQSDVEISHDRLRRLDDLCRRTFLLRRDPRHKPSIIVRALSRLMSLLPGRMPSNYITYDRDIALEQIRSFIGQASYDAVLWVVTRYSEWLLALHKELRFKRVVLDIVDSPFLYASRGKLAAKSQLEKIRCWEAHLINTVDAACYISPADAAAIPHDMLNKSRSVIPNGVYADDYTPAVTDTIRSPSIGFLGSMSYVPNVEATLYLYDHVYIPLKRRIPDLSLWIIGRTPAEPIVELGRKDGVYVTGTVDDIWPYVNGVDVFALPLQSGSGQQNKILEVMLAGKPVITTTIGNGGIGGKHGTDLLVCDHPKQWLSALEALLLDEAKRRELGQNGKDFVSQNYNWDNISARMLELVFPDVRAVDAATGTCTPARAEAAERST